MIKVVNYFVLLFFSIKDGHATENARRHPLEECAKSQRTLSGVLLEKGNQIKMKERLHLFIVGSLFQHDLIKVFYLNGIIHLQFRLRKNLCWIRKKTFFADYVKKTNCKCLPQFGAEIFV